MGRQNMKRTKLKRKRGYQKRRHRRAKEAIKEAQQTKKKKSNETG